MSQENRCFICDARLEAEALIRGARGAICKPCVFSLSARIAESERMASTRGEAPPPLPTSGEETRVVDQASVNDAGSAHDYASRMDLAVAYREMGRSRAAVRELLAALDAAMVCGDLEAALRCLRLARDTADSPAVRDQICDILTRHAPQGDTDA